MKVVQLITRLIVGGAQRIALETAAELQSRSIDAELWCGPQTGPEGSLAGEAAERGILLRTVPDLVRSIDPRRDLAALRWLSRELRAARADVIHTHSSKAGLLGRRAARTAGVPRIVHTVHGWGFSERTAWIARTAFVAAERAAADWADTLVAVSESVRDAGLRHRIGRAEQYRVIRPGIDVSALADLDRLRRRGDELRRELGIDPNVVLAGTIGRLSPQKNPGMILDAAERIETLEWLVIGDGPLRGQLEREIARRRLGRRVHLAGLRTDTGACLGALDLFVLVSLWEGLPLTLLEAQAAGVPIIASSVGGIEEVVSLPPAGSTFPPGDLEAFVTALHGWLDVRPAARAAAAQLREEALREHRQARMLREILDLYGLESPR